VIGIPPGFIVSAFLEIAFIALLRLGREPGQHLLQTSFVLLAPACHISL